MMASKPSKPASEDASGLPTAAKLLSQCQSLQASLQAFQTQAAAQHTPVDISTFAKSVTAELRLLERLTAQLQDSTSTAESVINGSSEPVSVREHVDGADDNDDEADSAIDISDDNNDVPESMGTLRHALRSSNMSYLQTVWDIARSCPQVVALSRRQASITRPRPRDRGRDKSGKALVDIVADMGLLWVKIVTVGERKLLFEMAREGWDVGMWDGSESEDEGEFAGQRVGNDSASAKHGGGGGGDGQHGDLTDDEDEIQAELPLIKMVRTLVEISRTPGNKVQYRHPKVLICFPNLDEDRISTKAVTKVLAMLRATGASIQCGAQIKRSPVSSDSTGVEDLSTMLPFKEPRLTPAVNVDCTILLALISDLSHMELDENDAYNEPIKKQLLGEKKRPLLPQILYPALVGRQLITSSWAAERMRQIVDTLATVNEKKRADIIMGDGAFNANISSVTESELQQYLRTQSIHSIPGKLRLPIQVIDTEQEMKKTTLPLQASQLDGVLSDINKSVFLLGWCMKTSTITSNRAVAKQIEHLLQNDPEEIIGPDIFLIDVARSLVGKERVRRG